MAATAVNGLVRTRLRPAFVYALAAGRARTWGPGSISTRAKLNGDSRPTAHRQCDRDAGAGTGTPAALGAAQAP